MSLSSRLRDTFSGIAEQVTQKENKGKDVPIASVRYITVLSQDGAGICTYREAGEIATNTCRSLVGPISNNTTCVALRYGADIIVIGKLYP